MWSQLPTSISKQETKERWKEISQADQLTFLRLKALSSSFSTAWMFLTLMVQRASFPVGEKTLRHVYTNCDSSGGALSTKTLQINPVRRIKRSHKSSLKRKHIELQSCIELQVRSDQPWVYEWEQHEPFRHRLVTFCSLIHTTGTSTFYCDVTKRFHGKDENLGILHDRTTQIISIFPLAPQYFDTPKYPSILGKLIWV